MLASVVGFASSFTIELAGFAAIGASQPQAASGLFAICVVMGVVGIAMSFRTRLPLIIAWSTPGAALFVATGVPAGGYPAAVGAYLVAAALIVAAGLWRPFGRAVAAIPMPLANALLAGVLIELCLAPVHAVAQMPAQALPIIVAWALAFRFIRRYAVPVAVVVAAIVIALATPLPSGLFSNAWPQPVFVMPVFTLHAAIGIGVPLFIVTMASQNVPGLAVLRHNGYRPDVNSIFVTTGLASVVTAFMGGHSLNLAAITAALCAGPDADPDPGRRWIASAACGAAYLVLGLFASVAAAFIAASPPLLIEAVAGLALLGTLGSALHAALDHVEDRLPAAATFLTTASGITLFGIGGAFWGLLAGGALMALLRLRPA